MAEQTFNSKTLLRKLTDEYFYDLDHAKEQGYQVAWVNGLFPQEFLEAMDIRIAYPENLAAALGAKKGIMPYLETCEALGYSNDLCSYTRLGLGYLEDFNSEISNIPRPDMLFNCTNICGLCVKWFECTAKRLDIPYFVIDTPFQAEGDGATENDVDYLVTQFRNLVRQLEKLCGKPFPYEKFYQVMRTSRRVARAWKRATEYIQYVPSPMDGFNLFNYMFLVVCARGKESTAEYYELLADEMESFVKEHKSQFKSEQRHRIMWDGIACWPYLAQNHRTMAESGMILVGSFYPGEWYLDYQEDDIRSLARAYANRPPISSLKRQIDVRADIMEQASCDGALYHANRSCKILTFMQGAVRKGVYGRNGKPYTTFEGDQTDPTVFNPAQFETRIQTLEETLERAGQEEKGAR